MVSSLRLIANMVIFLSVSALAQKPEPKDVLKIKSTFDFEITGDGGAVAWDAAEWTVLTPRDGARSYYQTKVKLLYSQKGIYCLFFCYDKQITSTLKEDFADLYNEDVVEIFFWPDESMPVYFEYELSPLNYELPIIVPNNRGNFLGWRPWHFEGNRLTRHAALIASNERGVGSWTAEFFIPYTLLKPLLKEQPKKGSKWRANMYRIDTTKVLLNGRGNSRAGIFMNMKNSAPFYLTDPLCQSRYMSLAVRIPTWW